MYSVRAKSLSNPNAQEWVRTEPAEAKEDTCLATKLQRSIATGITTPKKGTYPDGNDRLNNLMGKFRKREHICGNWRKSSKIKKTAEKKQ